MDILSTKVELTKIEEILKEYYEVLGEVEGLEKLEELKNSSSYYNFLNLENRLKNVVLTGEEILQIDIRRDPSDKEISESNLYEKLSNDYNELNEAYEGLKEDNKNLLEEKIELELKYQNQGNRTLAEKLNQIKTIIKGKEGNLIDEIRRVVE